MFLNRKHGYSKSKFKKKRFDLAFIPFSFLQFSFAFLCLNLILADVFAASERSNTIRDGFPVINVAE